MTPISKLIRIYGFHLVAAVIIAAIVTVLITNRVPRTPEASLLLEISIPTPQETDDYQYDGYYALQAVELFGGTVIGWFSSPSVVEAIYTEAELSLPVGSSRRLMNVFRAIKRGPTLIEIQYGASTEDEIIQIASAINSVINERVQRAYNNERTSLSPNITISEPFIGLSDRDVVLRAVVAGLVTFIVGISAILFIDAMREGK